MPAVVVPATPATGSIEAAGELRYFVFTAQSGGWHRFTVEPTSGGLDPLFTVLDDAGDPIPGADGSKFSTQTRYVFLTAGQLYAIQVQGNGGTTGSFEVEVNDVFQLDGDRLIVHGTETNDTFEYQETAEGYVLTINGAREAFSTKEVASIEVRGYGGSGDTAVLMGRAGTQEYAVLGSGGGVLERGENRSFLRMDGFEASYFYGQSEDGGQLYDSAGDDLFVSDGRYAYMSGPEHFRFLSGVSNVYGYTVNGGNDQAWHYDTAGTDSYVPSGSAYSYMSGHEDGHAFFNVAVGFPVNYAYSTEGGVDYAYFLDSPGNDVFFSLHDAFADYAYMSGPGFYSLGQNFEVISGQSFVGGTDTAYNYAQGKTALSGFRTVFNTPPPTVPGGGTTASSDAAASKTGTDSAFAANTSWRPAEDEDEPTALDELLSDPEETERLMADVAEQTGSSESVTTGMLRAAGS